MVIGEVHLPVSGVCVVVERNLDTGGLSLQFRRGEASEQIPFREREVRPQLLNGVFGRTTPGAIKRLKHRWVVAWGSANPDEVLDIRFERSRLGWKSWLPAKDVIRIETVWVAEATGKCTKCKVSTLRSSTTMPLGLSSKSTSFRKPDLATTSLDSDK